MRFAHKVVLMPAFAALSFIVVLAINEVTGTANAKLMRQIQEGYLPALELSRGAETALVDVQRSLHDAVAAADDDELGRADGISANLLANLRRGRTNPVFVGGEIDSLEAAYIAHYAHARATAVRMIEGEQGDSLQTALEKLGSGYTALHARLAGSTARHRTQMEAALEQARQNHVRSVRIMTLALVLGLLAVAGVSRAVIRSTVGSLRDALAASARPFGNNPDAVSPAPYRSGDEIAQALLASMQEITTALAVGHRQLNEAQRLSHLGSWEWDMLTGRVTLSEELQRIFAVDGRALTTVDAFLGIVHPDDRARVEAITKSALANPGPFQYQARIVRPDGDVRTLSQHNEVVVDTAGVAVGLRGASQDVTEAEHSAAALRGSEERYRTLFENNPQPMWVYDLQTLRFLAVNGAAAVGHYGYSSGEFLAMTIADLFPEADRDAARRSAALSPPGIKRSGVWRQRRKDGRPIDVEISSHSIDFGSQPARLVLALDVTEKRRLEDQLRQSQKMEAVGRLAGGVAHDFNNILGVIMGYGEMVQRRIPAADPLQGKMAEIMKAAERAAALTQQLLAFSRKQVLQPRVLDLNLIVADMEKMLRRLIGENIELRTSLTEPLGSVRADPGQVEQVLMNLAVNARDAMPGAGSILIETSEVDLDPSHITLHPASHPGPHVLLAFSDTGEGMDKEILSRVFEPFFTTKPLGKGTGLGLSTVYGIVEQSGGHVDVYSEKGRGTTFKVYLPCIEATVARAAVHAAPPPRRARSETVLLVEDEPALRGMIGETLAQGGYRVLEAATPREALDVARAHSGPIHAVLTDVVMPEMSGRDLAERLKPLRPEAPVVYMSGYTDDAIGHHGLLDPGTLFLQKPFTADALLWKLHQALTAA